MTEAEKMTAGKLYDPSDKVLAAQRAKAHRLSKDYNDTYDGEAEKRSGILKKLVPNMGQGTYIQGPIQFDYGIYTRFGKNCYANYNFVILDSSPVTIGNNVFFGPNCTIATPVHPLLPDERRLRYKETGEMYDLEYSKPIVIEDDCWIASDVTICGGVTIGKGTVIGAGSVVTRSIPSGVIAAGNPCRVIREITEADSVTYNKELY